MAHREIPDPKKRGENSKEYGIGVGRTIEKVSFMVDGGRKTEHLVDYGIENFTIFYHTTSDRPYLEE